jgi:response regulator NasT
MAAEKYIVATAENPVQIAIRNMLNPYGFMFLEHCRESASLMRMVRTYQPDFIVVDLNLHPREIKRAIKTIDEELICICILVGDCKDAEINSLIEKSNSIYFCQKPINREILINTVELSLVFYKKIFALNNKLKEATENFETRKLIDRAKWILIERDGISENEAYDRMRRKSMDNRTSMKAIAKAIIISYEITQ